MKETLLQNIEESLPVLQEFAQGKKLSCGLVLGSGIGGYVHSAEICNTIPYAEVPHMKVSTAASHAGQFTLLRVGEKYVLCMQGRLHGYEGYTAAQVAFPIWLMAKLGVPVLVTTNAAGAINPCYAVGDLCLMKDYINLTGRNPLAGIEPNSMASRFVPMNNAFDSQLRATVVGIAAQHSIPIQEGVYLALLGPSFETPAEIRAFATLGADTVAMSVVEEVIAARHSGMRVVGLSLVTNKAAGIEGAVPNDEEIQDVAQQRLNQISCLLNEFITQLPM